MLELKRKDIDYAEIKANLELTDEQKPKVKQTIKNYITIFEYDANLKNLIRYNQLSEKVENALSGENWTDEDDSMVMFYIEEYYHLRSRECYFLAFNVLKRKNSYNPIRVFLEKNKWDGKKRIPYILQKYLKCENSAYTQEVSRLIFMGGYKRLVDSGCKFDYMPILVGKQGTGKSTFIRWLALEDKYFKEVTSVSGKEAVEQLLGGWICEVSELLAFRKSKETEAIKSFISRQEDSTRLSYERHVKDFPRKCIFIGTTNSNEFLTDKTGNRRFLPLQVNVEKNILFKNEKECKYDILQCWLEAKYCYENNKNISLDFDQKLDAQLKEIQDSHTEQDWREGYIENFLNDPQTNQTCVKEIWDFVFGYEDKIMTKKDSNEIALIMDTKFSDKWEKVSKISTKKYGRQRGWKRKV